MAEQNEPGPNQQQESPPATPPPVPPQPQGPPTQVEKPLAPQQQGRDRRYQQQGRERRHQQERGRREGQQSHREGGNDLSIVIPVYNEEQSLRELYESIRSVANRLGRYEIIFVDDGSTDESTRVMHDLRNRDRRVKIIRFRRNYGKSAALSVGFAHAEGNIIVTMDADLHDDPMEIPNLVSGIKKGPDLVFGWHKK